MTKQDIIDHLTNNCGLHRSSAIHAADGFIGAVSDALTRGEAVTLRGFGTIKPVQLASKPARNLNTGETVIIPARRSVKIILSKELKEKLNS